MKANNNITGISMEIINKIAKANQANTYTDITPFELRIGYPFVDYGSVMLQKGEVLIYAAPANVFNDKEKIMGYTGGSSGVSVRVAKGVSIRTGSSKGKPIRNTVREISIGDLVITNKRVLFIAQKGGFDYPVNKISACKILSQSTFIIQTGSTSKSISISPVLMVYAITFINQVIDSCINGDNLYEDYNQSLNNLTSAQIQLCKDVRNEAWATKTMLTLRITWKW